MDKIKNFFLNSTLSSSISVTLLLGIFLPVLITSYVLLQYEYRENQADYEQFQQETMDVLERTAEVALWNIMPELSIPMLEHMMKDKRILAIEIKKNGGQIFQKSTKENTEAETQVIQKDVEAKDETLGTITVHFMKADFGLFGILDKMAPYLILFILFFTLGLALIIYLLKVKVVSPVSKLTHQSKMIADKELDSPFNWDRKDEIGQLGESLEQSRVSLLELFSTIESQNEELKNLNKNLDNAVKERTRELENTIEELKSTQSQLIESEKLAALGQIVAGVAHEINSPLGAIKSSTEGVGESIKKTLLELPKILQDLSDENRELFYRLMENMGSEDMTFKEKRALKKQLFEALSAMGIDHETRRVADMLAGMGIKENIEQYKPLLMIRDNSRTLMAAYHIGDVIKSIKNIHFAAERAGKVVFALKSFARFDASEEKAIANLHEGLETALTIYRSQIKHSVEVKKDYGNIPEVMCWADELNQVWTNLIHNALQAMEYNGILEISTHQENGFAVVSVKDNGCGMDEVTKEKIFRPFFTTKRRGEGSGLGLDIVNKIVTKHSGKIEIDTQKGVGTTFKIYIPMGEKSE